ncbi:type II secretion system protein GspK [Bowmanella pacifica]|uniref:T2SS protein K first SAM-like domain-containing protein n=1 Tax=Bowmanella pacifica TaxID=502051 RepID=A0A918DFU7_9ALTE|nr:type II secretion system protein GspK [Bowmanella pacifica]GGO63596.1 hypothetical protein GCM10010982_01000 [Bowmanella pacifica]
MILVSRQKGAALLAVLVVAVVLVVMLGVASALMQQRLSLAYESKQMLSDQAEVYAKANQLTYLLVTQRWTFAGVSQGLNAKGFERNEDGLFLQPLTGDELRMDGYEYKTDEGLKFSLQNENGLLPINSASPYWLKRWLKGKGYSAPDQARYADRLADYADGDQWSRPGGAEGGTYEKAKLPPPRNYLLQQCTELARVYGWQSLLSEYPDILTQCSLRRTPVLNINAIPVALWAVIWPDSAERLALARAKGEWFTRFEQAYQVEPGFLLESQDYYSPLGGNRVIIRIYKGGVGIAVSVQRGQKNTFPYVWRQVL